MRRVMRSGILRADTGANPPIEVVHRRPPGDAADLVTDLSRPPDLEMAGFGACGQRKTKAAPEKRVRVGDNANRVIASDSEIMAAGR